MAEQQGRRQARRGDGQRRDEQGGVRVGEGFGDTVAHRRRKRLQHLGADGVAERRDPPVRDRRTTSSANRFDTTAPKTAIPAAVPSIRLANTPELAAPRSRCGAACCAISMTTCWDSPAPKPSTAMEQPAATRPVRASIVASSAIPAALTAMLAAGSRW